MQRHDKSIIYYLHQLVRAGLMTLKSEKDIAYKGVATATGIPAYRIYAFLYGGSLKATFTLTELSKIIDYIEWYHSWDKKIAS